MKLNPMKAFGLLMIGAAILLPLRLQAEGPKTEIEYLSGHGPKDAVPWDFQISGGRRSGEATTIPVPSNWELHGFGKYTYGNGGGSQPAELGFYSRKFTVPESWSGRRINLVFNGVMTDATVKVNGLSAGPHRRFLPVQIRDHQVSEKGEGGGESAGSRGGENQFRSRHSQG